MDLKSKRFTLILLEIFDLLNRSLIFLKLKGIAEQVELYEGVGELGGGILDCSKSVQS